MPPIGAASMIGDAPLTKANDISGFADELLRQGDYSRAAQEHLKAAELYLQSVQYTQDVKLQTSLQRMHAEQLKLAEAAQRRAAQRERERELYPSRASGPSSSNHHHKSSRRTAAPRRGMGGYQSQSDASPSMTPPLSQSPRSSVMPMQESIMSDASRTSGSESYMVLGPDYPEANDTFQKFWDNLEGLADQMTQAIAFTTVPLGDIPDAAGDQISQTTNAESSDIKSRGRKAVHGSKSGILSRSKIVAPMAESEDEESSDSDSWDMIPSASSPPQRKPSVAVTSASTITPTAHITSHNKQLQEENEKLQVEMEQMRMKMTKLENVMKLRAGQSAQLKESIMMAKREAQRNLIQSVTFRQPTSFTPMSPLLLETNTGAGIIAPSPLTANIITQQRSPSPFAVPPALSPPVATSAGGSPSISQQQNRIRELEDENRSLKSEVTKLRSQNNRFRDKWATLKEGARRKRMLRDQQALRADGDGGVTEDVRRLSIKEEEEEEDDGDDVPGGR
ncbi:hypothetical protein FRB94_002006 [Tulasnella sp. JGI-2019a]|nr:hypothetical protein FRB93_003767 [Tulasnella sp. JGI-2019a]KAG9004839.1 hypothetical protein FRB94_002006 [Tulasnella sp. JGI-2019a]KAG9032148.1 hypothetical protein FRB95_001855 [Tulasnella sp. JGI-2019a]